MSLEDYEKLILEILYKGFMSDPHHRINNKDVESAFGKIDGLTNFKIAREKLIQEDLIYGKHVNNNNPPYFQITGDGLIYYEKKYITSEVKKEFSILISKILMFLRDLGDKKYDISNYIEEIDNRYKQAKIPRHYINKILNDDYDYEMNDLKWLLLYFTSRFVSRHLMGMSGVGISKEYLLFHNPDTFCVNLEGYTFLIEIFGDKKSPNSENESKINFIISLLNTKECEYLDFKLLMYDLLSDKIKKKWEQKKEFLKDVLSLINNKSFENSSGKAYIIIGVGDKNEKYDGTHKNIGFKDSQTLIQLINEHITPKLIIEFDEYFISGDKKNILISDINKEGYDRNILIKLIFDIGTIYEIKKKIGNPDYDVPYYNEGTSFTRDGSHTRWITQEDRERIMSLLENYLTDEYGIENHEEIAIELLKKIDEQQEFIYELTDSKDSSRKHLKFSFVAVPINISPKYFNFEDENFVKHIKKLFNEVKYKNPYGPMHDFDKFLRDFKYHGNYYKSELTINNDELFNFGSTEIHKDGVLSNTIAINAYKFGSFDKGRNIEELSDSIVLPSVLLAYLIMMWLKLIKSIYIKLSIKGTLKLSLSIYSGWELILYSGLDPHSSNNIEINVEKNVIIDDLRKSDYIFKLLKSLLMEILRFFNIDIDDFEYGYMEFEETINNYFDHVFC